MFESIDSVIDILSLGISGAMSLIYLPKLAINLYKNETLINKKFKDIFKISFFNKELWILIKNIPIVFYMSSICSTGVFLVFSKLIALKPVHMPTFFMCLILFFYAAVFVRFSTITIISNEIKGYAEKYSGLLNYVFVVTLLPCVFDSSNFRKVCSGFLKVNDFYNSVMVIIAMFILYFFVERFTKYISWVSTGIFVIIILSILYGFKMEYIASIFYLDNNIFTFTSVIRAILYANMFCIYSADLYCLCMERTLVNYTNKNKDITNKSKFFFLTSFVISSLAFIWLYLFLNLECGYFSPGYPIDIIISYAISTIFLLSSIMQIYILMDYINVFYKKIIALIFIIFFNYLWYDGINYLTVVVFLFSQFLTSICLFSKNK